MPSKVRRTLDVMRQSRESYINNEAFARNLNRSLSFDPINTLYVRGTSEYENKFIDQTARNDDSIIPKLIYGEVWLDSQVINRGIKRSTADPSQLVDEFEIVNGVGQNEGLKNDNDDSEDGLNNLVINGLAAVLGGIAAYQIADFIYKRSNDSGNSIWDDVTDVVGQEVFGDEDPNTGEKIEEQTNEVQPNLGQLKNVNLTGAQKSDVLTFDSEGTNCSWTNKPFNELLLESGLDVLGLDIKDSGTLSASDIHTINFNENLTVVVDGNGQVTVNTIEVTDPDPDPEPEPEPDPDDPTTPKPPSPTAPCKVEISEKTEIAPCLNKDDISDIGLISNPAIISYDPIGTNGIDIWVHIDGLYRKERVFFSVDDTPPFPCAEPYPLSNGQTNDSFERFTTGSVTVDISLISNICGTPTVIHQESKTYSGFNPDPIKKKIPIRWNNIEYTECMNLYPLVVISPNENHKLRVDKDTSNNCGDLALIGYTKITGEDWKDGGLNKARRKQEVEKVPAPSSPSNPNISITSDKGQPEIQL